MRDHDSADFSDDMDAFNHNFKAKPAKTSATAGWHYPDDISGTRERDQSRSNVKLLPHVQFSFTSH